MKIERVRHPNELHYIYDDAGQKLGEIEKDLTGTIWPGGYAVKGPDGLDGRIRYRHTLESALAAFDDMTAFAI